MQKFLNKKTIVEKLNSSFKLIFGMLIIIAIMAVIGLATVNLQMKDFYERSHQEATLQLEIRRDLQAANRFILSAVTTDDKTEIQEYLKEANTYAVSISDNIALLEKSFKDDVLTEKLISTVGPLGEEASRVTDLVKKDQRQEALGIFYGTYTEAAEDMQKVLREIGEVAEADAKSAYQLSKGLGIVIIAVIVAVAVVSLLVSRKLSKVITASICEPVEELEAAAEKLKKGELDITISYESDDELGQLADNFRGACTQIQEVIDDMSGLLADMAEGNFNVRTQAEDRYIGNFEILLLSIRKLNRQLDSTLRKINETSDQVAVGSGQMANSAQALAEGATDQAGAIEELTATVENVTDISEKSAETAKGAAEQVKVAGNNAQKSREEMERLTYAMERISETSKEIENIISAIEDIASQTNLLSLNASIEAARAGEAGKGFAVVADQIGKLASDSAQSAVTTRELIGKSLEEIENGNRITKRTSASLGEVLASMEEFNTVASGAAEASIAQAGMLNEIKMGIEQISSVVQSNSAAAEETSAVSQELSAQSENLKEMVAKFQLREE